MTLPAPPHKRPRILGDLGIEVVHRAPVRGGPVAQRGVVLFVALIVMVVMTLAAIALLRSTDTTTQAIGNIALRQASILPADAGIEAAAASLFAGANKGGPMVTDPTQDLPALNYYASYRSRDDSSGVPEPLQSPTSARSLAVQLNDDAGHHAVTYVIERMCREPGIASVATCDLMSPPPPNGASENDPELPAGTPVPVYRVTVRVDGPKNTASFLQASLRSDFSNVASARRMSWRLLAP